jgi:prepilin-type N-terminal cleavage/methylation domain-containing protein/prepilin-type processing-associated H-X9-DG protein
MNSHHQDSRPRAAFTLIELLVVIAIIALLIGILVPALQGARTMARGVACSAKPSKLGTALAMYQNDFPDRLPQVRVDVGGGFTANIGSLFGGKKGTLPFYGINEFGAERRPLNRYLSQGEIQPDAADGVSQMPAYQSPADIGGDIPGVGNFRSLYDALGSSYTLNDHALNGDGAWTLIPPQGGKMPRVDTPTRTWVLGSHTIYNFQENGNRNLRWYGRNVSNRASAAANLLFIDGHVKSMIDVPLGVVNTTSTYTFLPQEPWAPAGS